jgi:hypothetical protein
MSGKTAPKLLKLDLPGSQPKPRKKQSVPLTYKDYMVKEEANKSLKPKDLVSMSQYSSQSKPSRKEPAKS